MKFKFLTILFFLFCFFIEKNFAQKTNQEVDAFVLTDEALEKSNERLEYNIGILNQTLGLHFLSDGMARQLKANTPEEQLVFDAFAEFDDLMEMIKYGRAFLTDLIGRKIDNEQPITKDNTKATSMAFRETGYGLTLVKSIKKAKAAFEKAVEEKNRKEGFELFPMNPTTSINGFQGWLEYTFEDLDLIGAIALLNKIKNDALAAKHQLLLQLLEKNDKANYNPKAYEVYQLVSTKNDQLINMNETYETDIQVIKKVMITRSTGVNFRGPKEGRIRIIGGQPNYQSFAKKLDKNNYNIKSIFSNPILGTKDSLENEFSFLVGTKKNPVYLVPENSDDFYIGIKSRFRLFATGVDIDLSLIHI